MKHNSQFLLDSTVKVASIHADRIAQALEHINHLLPITAEKINAVSFDELGHLEIVTSRFAKLQDIMGTKIFPLLLDILQENSPSHSMIDRLNKLEKLRIIDSAHEWSDMRGVRNTIAHEYPGDAQSTADHLEKIIENAQRLLDIWNNVKKRINQELDNSLSNSP